MREIMFNKNAQEFVYFGVLDGYEPMEKTERSWCDVQQFTGLKDKNGKEIYEGDILGKKNPDWLKGFSDKWEIKFGYEQENDYGEKAFGYRTPEKDFEIIGDIYSTPELLK